jgi:hypothetical protein
VYNEKVRRENQLSDQAWIAAEEPADGCERKAHDELWRGIRYDTSEVNKLERLIYSQATRAAQVRRATSVWARCMHGKGFRYGSPDKAIDDPAWRSRVASPRQIAVAVADLHFKGSGRFVEAAATAEASLQRIAIARHALCFRRVRADKSRYLRRARSIRSAAARHRRGAA